MYNPLSKGMLLKTAVGKSTLKLWLLVLYKFIILIEYYWSFFVDFGNESQAIDRDIF
ncbi:hypothetical protein D3C87_1362310 [compost metagenome]